MPLNGALATITKETFDLKLKAAKKKLFVDTAFWGGLTQDNVLLSEDGANVEDLKMLLSSGVAGVKSFLNEAGFGFTFVKREHIEAALPVLEGFEVPLLVKKIYDCKIIKENIQSTKLIHVLVSFLRESDLYSQQ